MIIKPVLGPEKTQMRAIVEAIVSQDGLKPQFYWPADLLGAELATADSLGVFEDSELCAFFLYRKVEAIWDISLVACRPEKRRQGWTEKLFAVAIAAKSQEAEFWLEVHEENVPAQKLYEKLGFKEVRRRPRYYADQGAAILYSHASR